MRLAQSISKQRNRFARKNTSHLLLHNPTQLNLKNTSHLLLHNPTQLNLAWRKY